MGRVNQVHAVMVGGMAGRYIGQSVLAPNSINFIVVVVVVVVLCYKCTQQSHNKHLESGQAMSMKRV